MAYAADGRKRSFQAERTAGAKALSSGWRDPGSSVGLGQRDRTAECGPDGAPGRAEGRAAVGGGRVYSGCRGKPLAIRHGHGRVRFLCRASLRCWVWVVLR